jgi:4-alpha-glucanotransferase
MMELSPEKKIAGVLAPLFALRREDDLGIGDIAALRELIDWAGSGGFRLVQLLPINETGGDNSPYNAISAMAIEPTTLHLAPGSPRELSQEDFDSVVAHEQLPKLRQGAVKYGRVKKLKRLLLEKAFANFSAGARADGRAAFSHFREQEASWLEEYTFFRVLMEKNRESEAWDQWLEEHQTLERAKQWLSALSADEQVLIRRRQDFFAYVQWVAHEQWREVKTYAEERGVGLMGDIPFGVSYYSADVFAQRNEFALDWSGGAPPEPYFKDDPFTQKWGQNWGIPVYRWDVMRSNNLQWWRRRVSGVRHVFHVFRIDHVLGFYRIYAFPWRPQDNNEFLPLEWHQMLERTGGHAPQFVPRPDSTWENCEANRREGEGYLRAVLEDCGPTRVVGEDLGTVPDYVRPNLRSLGIAGFKIPQWEVHDGRVTPGAEYERLSLATYATHDHKPLRALWEEAFEAPSSSAQQARYHLSVLATFAHLPAPSEQTNYEREFYPAIMEALFRSESWIAVVMLTDLLGLRDRFNVPGTATAKNWTRRMRMNVSQFPSSRTVRARLRLIKELLEKSGRI